MSAVPLTLHPRIHHWAQSQANTAGLTLSAWIEQQLVRLTIADGHAKQRRTAQEQMEADARALAIAQREAIEEASKAAITRAVRADRDEFRKTFRAKEAQRIEKRFTAAVAEAFDTTVDVLEDMIQEATEARQ